jgi:hypothetical protein
MTPLFLCRDRLKTCKFDFGFDFESVGLFLLYNFFFFLQQEEQHRCHFLANSQAPLFDDNVARATVTSLATTFRSFQPNPFRPTALAVRRHSGNVAVGYATAVGSDRS